ncbi:MAG: hypothetical protein PVG00_04920 [Desulfobacterales bacterium]
MKEHLIQTVEMSLLPSTFRKIGTQDRGKLRLFGDIDQLYLIETIEHLRGGYPQTGGTRDTNEF